MSNQSDRLNTALTGRYRVERHLGEGGMASVYLAEDLKHDRKVAIKVLREDLSASLGKERFLREVKVAAALQHPHILALYDSGEAEGLLFYVMPYVDGESLRMQLARGPLPVSEALGILRNVAQALVYAHEHGVVHRDIKPDNVLLSSGTAVVADFGIAKAVSASSTHGAGATLTAVGTSIGTPAYMAPEQAVGEANVDHRADLYAWGVMAYELLAEAHPFAMHTTPQASASRTPAATPRRSTSPTGSRKN